ncbi:MAG: hypothetical protein ACQGVK_21845 [Myxococcota bacterium]
MAEFRARLREATTKPIDLSRWLDGLAEPDRIAAVRGLGRSDQRRLWQRVDGFAAMRLRDLVPPEVPALATVRHYGRNTLPAFSLFEKRFTRPSGENAEQPGELHGFNFQAMQRFTGPGYFVAVEAGDRAEVLVDYRRLPDQHPEGWPEIVSNERGVARFVYGFMVDTLRRVSEHVSIGRAARKGRDMGSWFALCREEHPNE